MKQKKINIKVNEITPDALYCGVGVCPSVFEIDGDKLLIIGKILDEKDIPDKVKKKIGQDEMVIEVPRNLITDLNIIKK